MKLQLDTTNKTIKLESSVKLKDLVANLKKLLPNNEWQEFTLETNTVINNWSSPYIIEKIREVPVYPRWGQYPWYGVSVGTTTGNIFANKPDLKFTGSLGNVAANNMVLKSGTFNVEL